MSLLGHCQHLGGTAVGAASSYLSQIYNQSTAGHTVSADVQGLRTCGLSLFVLERVCLSALTLKQ